MKNQHRRALVWTVAVIAIVWLAADAGRRMAARSRVTVDKVLDYLHTVQFADLDGKNRDAALAKLAAQINALSLEDRRLIRRDRKWIDWLSAMTDAEKERFVEATFPTGIKTMINAFEKLPEEKRKVLVDDALHRLRETGDLNIGEEEKIGRISGPRPDGPVIDPVMEAKVRVVGLRTFFGESSAQTKVDATPLLEEIQRRLQNDQWRLPDAQ